MTAQLKTHSEYLVCRNATLQATEPVVLQFEAAMRSYVYFNLLFLSFGFLEFVILLLLFSFFTQSGILAFSLAILFLTIFSYFILRVHYQTKKREQFQEVRESYLAACKRILNYQEGISEHHVALANACAKLADSLRGREYHFYTPPKKLEKMEHYFQKFSCWCHWQDVHRMREFFLSSTVEESIKLVKTEPANFEVHAALANAYIMMSGLYSPANNSVDNLEDSWIANEAFAKTIKEKFRIIAERAIEEFKIMSELAPNDPWVHAQLAYSYHDLNMPLDEIREYEIMQKLDAGNLDTLFKLGILYFQQGFNAKGLLIYEQLKKGDSPHAEELIKFYGAYEAIKL